MNTPSNEAYRPIRTVCALLAGVAFFWVCWTINDPGITVDETIYVRQGKVLFNFLAHEPARLWSADQVNKTWDPIHEHPPLGRLLLGLAHEASDSFRKDPAFLQPKLARLASALAFALLVYCCCHFTWQIAGVMAGLSAGVAVLLMPRLFGHAHLATLEMISVAASILALTNLATVLYRESRSQPFAISLILAGVTLGLALLTKMSAVLVILGGVAGAVWCRRAKAILPLSIWLLIGGLTFIGGWPWLWPIDVEGYAPGIQGIAQRLQEFVSTGFHRATIFVWYFGEQRSQGTNGVPWHYVWVISAVTIPLGTLIIALLGGVATFWKRSIKDVRIACLAASLFATYLLFSLPVERYDGERLFLFLFPIWGMFFGVGASWLAESVAARRIPSFFVWIGVMAMLAYQGYDLRCQHPFELSFFNSLVGGLSGAERLGLEPTYWGDSLTEELLDKFATAAPNGARAYLFPTLHPDHPAWILTAEMKRKHQEVLPGDVFEKAKGEWAILFHRTGYLADPMSQRILKDGEIIAQVAREGVWLGRVYKFAPRGN